MSRIDEKKMNHVDLHIHSIASDGTWSVLEILERAAETEMELISITDHNTTEAQASCPQQHSMPSWPRLLPGVEISSFWNGHYLHILGYGISTNRSLDAFLGSIRAAIDEQDEGFIETLGGKGFRCDIDSFRHYRRTHRGGWKVPNYLVSISAVEDINHFFTVLPDWSRLLPKVRLPGAGEAISMIREAGGAAVLAHPGSYSQAGPLEELLLSMLKRGIQGVECFHPVNSARLSRVCTAFCRRYGLLITGGSDCHGDGDKSRSIGIPRITLSMLSLGDLR
jgi:predicted metal-dependent phosphoesterase TrpH